MHFYASSLLHFCKALTDLHYKLSFWSYKYYQLHQISDSYLYTLAVQKLLCCKLEFVILYNQTLLWSENKLTIYWSLYNEAELAG